MRYRKESFFESGIPRVHLWKGFEDLPEVWVYGGNCYLVLILRCASWLNMGASWQVRARAGDDGDEKSEDLTRHSSPRELLLWLQPQGTRICRSLAGVLVPWFTSLLSDDIRNILHPPFPGCMPIFSQPGNELIYHQYPNRPQLLNLISIHRSALSSPLS